MMEIPSGNSGGGTVLAPAKINLHLRVGPLRADGFHPLLTCMITLGLMDELRFSVRTGSGLVMTCSEPSLPTDEKNLVMRAARAVGGDPDLAIHLVKRIPHGGGLGGGSSDAASTLLSVNRLLGRQLAQSDLQALAERLGSDVPFFLHGPCSVCKGRGEEVRPIAPPRQARWALLLLPAIQMPTPAVYRQFDQMRLGQDEDIQIEPNWDTWFALPAAELMEKLVNDLEAPAFAIRPELDTLRDTIQQKLGRAVRMSGSGSSLFTLYDEHAQAKSAADLASKTFHIKALAVSLAPDIADLQNNLIDTF